MASSVPVPPNPDFESIRTSLRAIKRELDKCFFKNTAAQFSTLKVGAAGSSSDGTAALPSYSFINDPNTGMYRVSTDSIGFTAGGVHQQRIQASAFINNANVIFCWSSSTTNPTVGTADVSLIRVAAGQLGIHQSTSGVQVQVYGTRTDASNYERMTLKATAGSLVEIAAETAGTGGDNLDVLLTPAGTGNVRFGTHSAIAAETLSGYITIKDAAGNARKIGVIS